MWNKDIKDIINDAVSSKLLRYFELSEDQKHALVSEIMFQDNEVLIDADRELILRAHISHVIKKKGSQASLQLLYDVIKMLFIDGNSTYDAHYADHIDFLLDEEWQRQNASSNEHFEHDARNRARDANTSLNRY